MLASFGHLAPEPDFDRFGIDFRSILDRFLIFFFYFLFDFGSILARFLIDF